MEQIKFTEHEKQELRLQGKLPHCFFCSGDMLLVPNREKATWKCKDCGAVFRKGCPQVIANNIVIADLYNIEKAKRQSHGGGKSERKRKKDSRKRQTFNYPTSDAG